VFIQVKLIIFLKRKNIEDQRTLLYSKLVLEMLYCFAKKKKRITIKIDPLFSAELKAYPSKKATEII